MDAESNALHRRPGCVNVAHHRTVSEGLDAAAAAALADGNVTSKALECMARQPEEKSSLQINMLISVGLIESIPIIAAVIAIVLVMANPFVK